MTATMHWRKAHDAKNVDGAKLRSGTEVYLSSHWHQARPSLYEVHEVLPKCLWRPWGRKRIGPVTQMDASPADSRDPWGGWYYSEGWYLPEPETPDGVAVFEAATDSRDCRSIIRSSHLWLEEVTRQKKLGASVGPQLTNANFSIGMTGSAERGATLIYKASVPTDPWVEVTLLQGSQVLDHLVSLEEAYAAKLPDPPAATMAELPASSATYFVDRPLGEAALTWRLEPGVDLFTTIHVPEIQDLRAALSLRITDLTNDAAVISSPIFLTYVHDSVIATDLTFDMLRPEPRDLLVAFAETDMNLDAFAERIGSTTEQAWQQLVVAADEFGAESITDAIGFASQAVPALA